MESGVPHEMTIIGLSQVTIGLKQNEGYTFFFNILEHLSGDGGYNIDVFFMTDQLNSIMILSEVIPF